jgi:hypothetical protein
MSYHMRSQGVTFRLGEEVEEVTKSSEESLREAEERKENLVDLPTL